MLVALWIVCGVLLLLLTGTAWLLKVTSNDLDNEMRENARLRRQVEIANGIARATIAGSRDASDIREAMAERSKRIRANKKV